MKAASIIIAFALIELGILLYGATQQPVVWFAPPRDIHAVQLF